MGMIAASHTVKPPVRICLNMIVRNESRVIRRCLESVLPFLHTWVIVDTGSADNTREIIRECLQGIEGELHERPWKNFGYNRTEALQLAKGKGDYILIIDADEVLNYDSSFTWPELTAEGYFIESVFGLISYQRMQLVKSGMNWEFCGVLHEYIHCNELKKTGKLKGIYNIPSADGARSSDPEKYRKDALLLEQAMKEEPGNARYAFYLAQSYRDAGELAEAIRCYQQRVSMGGWDEEVWYSLYQVGVLMIKAEADPAQIADCLLTAFDFRPSRAEPLYRLAAFCRSRENYRRAYMYASMAAEIPLPSDMLFVEKRVYEYFLPMELAISAHWTGHFGIALQMNNRILDTPGIPAEIFAQTIFNRHYTVEAQRPRKQFTGRKNKIRVCVPFFNPGLYLDNCISSLLCQDYDNFEVLFIDDASTDNSSSYIPSGDPRMLLLKNDVNRGGGWNLHQAVLRCAPDDIFVQLDGDDWLSRPDALSLINRFFEETECWVMHGQFRYSGGSYGCARPFENEKDFSEMRAGWVSPVPRCFRAGIYHRIGDHDPQYECMRDAEGNWFKEAVDVAMFYPIFELAGYANCRFNSEVLYVYNTGNPLNTFKLRRDAEVRKHHEISAKRPFPALRDYRLPHAIL
jgi:glycosyltransferase involved in cell wall biosynthesis